MIEILNGHHETINYGDSLGLRLFHNVEYEDYPEHWHTGIEIIMPLCSEYTIRMGEERYVLNAGDIIIINSGVLHGLEAPPAGERVILQFDVSLLYTLKEMETLLALLPPVLLFRYREEAGMYTYLRERMDKIIDEYAGDSMFREASIYAKLIEMYVEIGRNESAREFGQENSGNRVQMIKQKEYMESIMSVCNYINRHYRENISLEEIAAISGFSKFHFTRIFKQFMNMTFYEYLNVKRIKRAEELLYASEYSITDVAMNSGFSSLSAFNRTFRSINGCSPSEYRNKVLNCQALKQ